MEENMVKFEDKLKELVQWHLAEGTDGIVALGTTGESSTMSHEEDDEVARCVIETVNGRIPVIAGTGSNDTAYSIDLSRYAASVGADAMLLVTPYYNKATQNGLYAHFKTIADASTVPVILYNVPGRTGCNLLPKTGARLAEHEEDTRLQ